MNFWSAKSCPKIQKNWIIGGQGAPGPVWTGRVGVSRGARGRLLESARVRRIRQSVSNARSPLCEPGAADCYPFGSPPTLF